MTKSETREKKQRDGWNGKERKKEWLLTVYDTSATQTW